MAKQGLTWHKARGVWRKKYRGKVYYLSKAGECKGPHDRRGYEQALLEAGCVVSAAVDLGG